MACMTWIYTNGQNTGKLILRLLIGGLMLPRGLNKITGNLDFIKSMLVNSGFPSFVVYGVYIGEILAPIMIILGFKTRIASLILILNMILAVYLVHGGSLIAFEVTGAFVLETIYFYIFGAAALIFLGPGQYSIDKN